MSEERSDADFLAAFEEGTLPRPEWTHAAHLRMAYLYLNGLPNAEMWLPVIRRRIQFYNAAHGNPGGYHETITAAFTRLVADRLRRAPCACFADFRNANPDLFEGTTVLMRHYRRETLYSPEARAEFVPPDLEALSEPGDGKSPARL
ncbi:MAG TPA: hypothetical protein VM490_21300 [Armatimonadaceae bacterium]|nr:hypothetical protein [Armatimonadaceae bacterium]